MKRNATLLVLVLLLNALATLAQIPNAGFEQLNTDGTIRNWGNVYLWPVYIDSSGNTLVDSIVVDAQMYFATPDAHSGSVALEMRNAWDFTLNQGISGGVTADTDSVYTSWGSFETIPIQIQNQPFNFSFFYEYFPVNSDTASATLLVYDSSMNQLGEAVILISDTVSNYTLATAPVIYTTPGTVAFAYIHFRTAAYGTQPSFGTRFLVDDVMFNYVTGVNTISDNDEMKIYPNPADEKINILLNNSARDFSVEIINSLGQIMSTTLNQEQIDISDLTKGIYLVRLKDEDAVFLKRVVKK